MAVPPASMSKRASSTFRTQFSAQGDASANLDRTRLALRPRLVLCESSIWLSVFEKRWDAARIAWVAPIGG
jgi:hypothetical protein